MKHVYGTSLLLLLSMLMACSTTLHLKNGKELEARMVSSTEDTLTVVPDNGELAAFREEGYLPEGYRGGPIDIAREDVEDTSNPSWIAALALSSVAITGLGLSAGSEGDQVLWPVGIPMTMAGMGATIPYLFESIDSAVGGSDDLRWGAGIAGVALAALGPALVPIMLTVPSGFEHSGEVAGKYLTVALPAMMATGLSMAIWGWVRQGESSLDSELKSLSVSPVMVPERDGSVAPGLGVHMRW